MNYSNKIKEVRDYFGLTQESLGKSINVSRHVISQIELGNNKPSLELISKIVNKYNIDYSFFFEQNLAIRDCITKPELENHQPIHKGESKLKPLDEEIDEDITAIVRGLSNAAKKAWVEFGAFLSDNEKKKKH